MKEISKQSDKNLSKVFFNSVEEMNECYGIDAGLPSILHSNVDLVCYEIVEPFVYEELAQYKFIVGGFYHLDNLGEPFIYNNNKITLETEVYEDDTVEWEGRCIVYVRVNEYLQKHLEKTLIGCEFIYKKEFKECHERRFIHSVDNTSNGVIVRDQNECGEFINNILLYPDDYSDPITYKEWVKKINEQEVDG